MKRVINWLIVMSLMAIAGCTPATWVKAGATQQDFAKDKYDCLQNSQQQVAGTRTRFDSSCNCNRQYPYSEVKTNYQLFNSCMNAKGWTAQDQKSAVEPK